MLDHDYKKNKETGRLEMVKPTNDNFHRIIASDDSELIVDKSVIDNRVQFTGTAARMKTDLKGDLVRGADGQYIKETSEVQVDIYSFNNEKSARTFYDFMANKDTNDVEFSISDIE